MATSIFTKGLWVMLCVGFMCQCVRVSGSTTATMETSSAPTTPYIPGLGDRCVDVCTPADTVRCVNHTCQCIPPLVNTTDKYCVTHPGKVVDFNYFDRDEESVTLEWSPPTTPGVIQQYHVFVMKDQRCVHGIFLSCFGTGPKQFNSSMSPCVPENSFGAVHCHENVTFNDTFPAPYTNFTYIVSANNQLFHGDNTSLVIQSPIVAALEPAVPVGTVMSSNTIQVQWGKPAQRTGPTWYTLDVFEAEHRRSTHFKKIKTIRLEGFNSTTCKVSGLLSSWNYNFAVTAHTEAGSSSTTNRSTSVSTLPSVPAKVKSMKVKALNTPLMGVELSWECPDERERNGHITSYTVRYAGDVVFTQKYGIYSPEDPCIETKTITLPVTDVNYTFTVFANAEFRGKLSEVIFKPDPSRMMYVLPANVLTNPDNSSFSTTLLVVSLVGSVIIIALVVILVAILTKRRRFRSARVTYAEKTRLTI